jgi:hypothetical protein
MPDKETFQKEIRAKLKQWRKIIDELSAEGEEKLINRSRDFKSFSKKGITIYDSYLEATRKFEEFAKADDATWEIQASDIKDAIKQLDHLWETLFAKK